MKKEVMVIHSNIDEIDRVYRWLDDILKDLVDEETSQKIILVCQEITTNAIIHGNRLLDKKLVIVTFTVNITSKEIRVKIKDEGDGIKDLPSKEEAMELDYLAEHGRGLKLAVLMSDNIEVEGNSIEATFNI